MAINIVALVVVLLALAVYFCWSFETVQMAAKAIELQYSYNSDFDWDEFTHSDESAVITKDVVRIKGAKHQDVDCVVDAETKSNHLFSLATGGEWGKLGRSHHDKGVTLHDYRKGNHLMKKVLHPCCIGGRSECFD